MAIDPIRKDGQALMTVKWAAKDSTGVAADVQYVHDFLVRMTDDGIRLSVPTDHLIEGWKRVNKGPIEYIVRG